MASASDHRAHAALQPADCLILLPQRLPAAVETSIGPAHYPAECTQSDAFLQPSLRARKGRANSNSFLFLTPIRRKPNLLANRKSVGCHRTLSAYCSMLLPYAGRRCTPVRPYCARSATADV